MLEHMWSQALALKLMQMSRPSWVHKLQPLVLAQVAAVLSANKCGRNSQVVVVADTVTLSPTDNAANSRRGRLIAAQLKELTPTLSPTATTSATLRGVKEELDADGVD